LHGDLFAASRYNFVGLVSVFFLLWAYGAWTYGRFVDRRIASWQHHRWRPAAALAVVSVWFVIRNLPIAPFLRPACVAAKTLQLNSFDQ